MVRHVDIFEKMASISGFIYFFLLWISVFGCLPEQPSVAFANNDQKTITFGFVSKSDSECLNATIRLVNLDKQTSQKIPLNFSQPYTSNKNKLKDYNKTGYFFETSLTPGDRYTWSVSPKPSANSSSSPLPPSLGPFPLSLKDPSKNSSLKFLMTADMDLSSISQPTLEVLHSKDWASYDGYLHVGDYAYDIHSQKGQRGDDFFNSLWDVYGSVPFFGVAGNHENYDEGRLFNYRFRLPNYDDRFTNHVYGVKRGAVYFLAINYDYFLKIHKTNYEAFKKVFHYCETLLKEAKEDSSIKFIVQLSHRPIYCGDTKKSDCSINLYFLKPFDELYRKYGVDLIINAHEHFYERIRRVDKNMNLISEEKEPQSSMGSSEVDDIASKTVLIVNPKTPIQIINGLAGNSERWVGDIITNNLSQETEALLQCYLEIEFEFTSLENSAQITLFSSKDQTVVHRVKLVKYDQSKRKSLKFPILIFVGFLLILVLATAFIKFKADSLSNKNTELPKESFAPGYKSVNTSLQSQQESNEV